MRVRTWKTSAIALAAMWVLMGAECSPTDPLCGEGPCTEEELPACINSCIPKLSRDEALGAACHTNPCDDGVLDGGLTICPTPLTCAPSTADGVGTCQDLAGQFFEICDPDAATDTCQDGTYCKPTEIDDDDGPNCPGLEPLNGEEGRCSFPRREGMGCDANWGSPGCDVCEPGTLCVPDPDRGGRLICQRSCDTDEDCPCTGPLALSTCEPNGFCGVCRVHGEACEYREPDPQLEVTCAEGAMPGAPGCIGYIQNEPYGCCDPADVCDPDGNPDLVAGDLVDGTCCRPEGAACTAGSGDCCGDDRCDDVTDTCVACGQFGEDPPTLNGEDFCCDGLENRGGRCVTICEEDTGSDCPACEGVTGTWICTDRGSQCEGPPSSEEDPCDGIDNDCDRRLDEDYEPSAETCMATDDDCGEVAGVYQCLESGETCVPDPDNLCKYTYGSGAFEGNADNCGVGFRRCETQECPPNSFCLSDSCLSDPGNTVLRCWPVDQPFCLPNSPDTYGTPFDESCDGQTVCWNPDEIMTFSGCPDS